MATSHFHQIPTLMRYIEMLWPKSILDVGAGIGKWGLLCRDRLEFLEGRCERNTWQTALYGVELYEGYRNPIWDYCYDGFWAADVLDVLEEIPNVDLVLLGDVLSFLPKDRGRQLVAELAKKGRHLLISTPVRLPERSDGKHEYNPATITHLSYWGPDDFSKYEVVSEQQGNTQFILVDVKGTVPKSGVVESAERYPMASLLRALGLKVLHKLKLPSGRFMAPHTAKGQFASAGNPHSHQEIHR